LTALPLQFRKVRLELAREPGHPEGASDQGYDLLVPLDNEGRLDAGVWRTHRDSTRVRRFRAGEADQIGKLSRRPGGSWYFDYEVGTDDDESGFRFGDEKFVPGEYVSIREADGDMRTFRVIFVSEP
jgi:hypothetical protein